MKILYFILITINIVHGKHIKLSKDEKTELCKNLNCDENEDAKVCGLRYETKGVKIRLFDNECKLLKFGCQVANNQTFGLISMKYCMSTENDKHYELVKFVNDCLECSDFPIEPVCGIRPDGERFIVRTFNSECELKKYNCEVGQNFTITDYFICSYDNSNLKSTPKLEKNGNKTNNENSINKTNNVNSVNKTNNENSVNKTNNENSENNTNKLKKVVIVHQTVTDARNINKSIENFFTSTHKHAIPLRDIQLSFNESTRKMMLKNFGPVMVMKPKFKIPKIVKTDPMHEPLISSCYHTCPKECPDIYAPVCGVPGISSPAPSLIFKNHCYMDVAQCNFHQTAVAQYFHIHYEEAMFVMCIGEISMLHRVIPLIKVLQNMGRLKKKGKFKQHINMKYSHNKFAVKNPKLVG